LPTTPAPATGNPPDVEIRRGEGGFDGLITITAGTALRAAARLQVTGPNPTPACRAVARTGCRTHARATLPRGLSPGIRVLVVGGGFGGLNVARSLSAREYDVTLVDKRNFHLFQPLLYQVATGGLSATNIAAPLRTVLQRSRNVRVYLGEVTGFRPDEQRVETRSGELGYDVLVVAAGACNDHFGHADWAVHAPGLKTLEDAAAIRSRILLAFEAAERSGDAAEWLRFVVVGAGPTGVELAGTLGEMARYTLRAEFRRIDPARAEILLVEAGPRILPTFAESLSARAARDLTRLGVTVRVDTWVTGITADSVSLRRGRDEQRLPCRTVLWAAGVKASPLGRMLADATGTETDKRGRLRVTPQLHLPGRPGIFVIGDMARVDGPDGQPLPGMAPVAIQQGRHVAAVLRARRRGFPEPGFRYRDRGIMTTIGRRAAVAQVGRFRFVGWLAWIVWLFVHLMQIVIFQNRALVLLQWAWNYVTYSRTSRIIVRDFARDEGTCP